MTELDAARDVEFYSTQRDVCALLILKGPFSIRNSKFPVTIMRNITHAVLTVCVNSTGLLGNIVVRRMCVKLAFTVDQWTKVEIAVVVVNTPIPAENTQGD
jgi:hypothetical protein